MKISSIVGARPQFIKLAPLSKELRKYHEEVIIHTGQHFDEEMSQLFFNELEINEPDYNLGISGGYHGEQTGRMIIELEKVIIQEKPDLVIVFGDTNSTLAGSLVTSKLGINSIHIEAGLRSFNRTMPEELNRIVSDHTSDYLFAPTSTAMNNLKNEGLLNKAFLSGDIMVDSLISNIDKAKRISTIINRLKINLGEFYLLTLHRPYTVDNPQNLALILEKLSELDGEVIFPVHPRTKKVLVKNSIKVKETIRLIKPLSYLDFIVLENYAKKIITDSGGIQKEAYILKKPCITLRSETEWVETIEEGWNILVLPEDKNFIDIILSFKPNKHQRKVFGNNVVEKMIAKIKVILKS